MTCQMLKVTSDDVCNFELLPNLKVGGAQRCFPEPECGSDNGDRIQVRVLNVAGMLVEMEH